MRSDPLSLCVLALCATCSIACADFSRGADTAAAGSSAPGSSVGAGKASFASLIHELLVDDCASCHSPSGNAASSDWVLAGDVDADLAETLPFIDQAVPATSRLLTKGAGAGHGGGRVHAVESPEYALVLQWIREGAPP